jgi:hypothetical protein
MENPLTENSGFEKKQDSEDWQQQQNEQELCLETIIRSTR